MLLGFSSLGIAASGLRAAQMNLKVTGHNLSNAEVNGYARQRLIQQETVNRLIGINSAGQPLRAGLGTDTGAIHHIRSRFFDTVFREHNAVLNFYATKTQSGLHVQSILGEMDGAFRLSEAMLDLWESLQEINDANLDSMEVRDTLIANASGFLDKAQNMFDELFAYQRNLDGQIRVAVAEVNELVAGIDFLNRRIRHMEMTGDNANDYRDSRARLMDRLSELIPMRYSEDPDTSRIDIFSGANALLSQGVQNRLGLKFISARYSLVEPVFTNATDILPANTNPQEYRPLFNWDRPINSLNGNDQGKIMALLQVRGAVPATYRGMQAIFRPVMPDARPNMGEPLPAAGTPEAQWWPFPVPPFPVDFITDAFPLGTDNPAFAAALAEYAAIWDAFPNDVNAVRPDPADFITDDFPLGHDNPAFVGAYRTYIRERENDLRNFQMQWPDSVNNREFFATVPDMSPEELQENFGRLYRAAVRTYDRTAWSMEHAMITRVMMEMDQVVNRLVNLLNQALSPATANGQRDYDNGPFDLRNEQSFVPIFVRRETPGTWQERFSTDERFGPDSGYFLDHGMVGNMQSMYTVRNLMINPALLREGGYNYLALSMSGDEIDARLINEILAVWGSNMAPDNPLNALRLRPDLNASIQIGEHWFSLEEAYQKFVVGLGVEISEANNFLGSQHLQTVQADNRRNAIMGVSTDEELSNMMTFQFAYQAAARLFNVIDGMIDIIVNRMGRVGL